jgi:predicted dehydrogenase
MSSIRVALAGLGNAATNLHLPALASIPGVTLAGGCDPTEARRTEAAQRWRMPAFADAEELLHQTNPDVLIVCTPPESHLAVALRAFAAGSHVICEKPIASSVAEADRILQAAAAAGRRIAMNHEFREMPAYSAVLDAARRDGAGVLFAQVWQNMNLPPWAEPGWRGQLLRGTLYEAGIHLVDYMMALFGEKPVAVTATMSSSGARDFDSDAIALVTLEFSRGRLGQVVQNRLCTGETQYFEVRADTAAASYRVSYGGRARVSAGLLRSTIPHMRVELGSTGIAWKEVGHTRTSIARNPGNAPMVATRILLEKTLRAFANQTAAPVPGEVGRDAVEVVAACYHSASTGQRVQLGAAAASLGKIAMAANQGAPVGV